MQFTLLKILCFATLLTSGQSNVVNDALYKQVLNRFAGQWDALWIAVSELAVRLDALEKRLEENKSEECAPSEKHDTDVVTSNYRTDDELKEEFMILKKAFVAEKENLREFVELLEQKVEAKMKDVGIETVTELKHKVNLLANEKTDKELSEDIQGRVRTVEKTLNSVQSIADALAKRTKLVESKANKMQDSSNEFEGRLVDIETSVSTIMETQNRKVSFTAQLKPPGDATAVIYKKNQIIKFNYAFYNDGNGFNTTSGVFTVPVSGVYQFIFFVEGVKLNEHNDCPEAIVHLFVDRVGIPIVAFAEPANKGHNIQAGNAYINYFTKGQQVLVGTAKTCETFVIAGYRTTFSGALLY